MGKKEDFAREHAGTEIPSRAVVVSNTLGAVAVCSYLHSSHLCCGLLALRIPKESQAQADVPHPDGPAKGRIPVDIPLPRHSPHGIHGK